MCGGFHFVRNLSVVTNEPVSRCECGGRGGVSGQVGFRPWTGEQASKLINSS